jgi:hypothetical protein
MPLKPRIQSAKRGLWVWRLGRGLELPTKMGRMYLSLTFEYVYTA